MHGKSSANIAIISRLIAAGKFNEKQYGYLFQMDEMAGEKKFLILKYK